MRAAFTTSNLAATQLFKTNRKHREVDEPLPSFISTGHHQTRRASAVGVHNPVRRGSTGLGLHGHHQHHGAHHQHENHGLKGHHQLSPTLGKQRLRTGKLKDLAMEEICLESMRKLFYLLDEDGGGTVDPKELKQGMEILGFEEVADPVVLDRLVREIDEDKTGTIEENEFLAFFSKESRASLKAKLQSWRLKYTHIKATRYCSQGKLDVQVAEIQAGSVGSWIKEQFGPEGERYNYWLEVTGYDQDTFTAMAEALGFSHEDLAALLVFQTPKCETVQGKHAEGASLIVPSAKLSLNPVPFRTGTQALSYLPSVVEKGLGILLGNGDDGVPSYLTSKKLAPKREIAGITISLEQAAVLVASNNMVLTFRNPICNYESGQLAEAAALSRLPVPVVWLQPSRGPDRGGLMRSSTVSMIEEAWGEDSGRGKTRAVAPEVSPFAVEKSTVRLQFERLRGKLAEQTSSAEAVANRDVKSLAVLLVDQLLTSNYVIRDRIQDWEELLEASIRSVENSASTHLEAMGALLDRFLDHLDHLAETLAPATWGEGAASEIGEEERSGGSPTRQSKAEDPPSKRGIKVKKFALGSGAPAFVVAPVTGVSGPDPAELPRISTRRPGAKADGDEGTQAEAPPRQNRRASNSARPGTEAAPAPPAATASSRRSSAGLSLGSPGSFSRSKRQLHRPSLTPLPLPALPVQPGGAGRSVVPDALFGSEAGGLSLEKGWDSPQEQGPGSGLAVSKGGDAGAGGEALSDEGGKGESGSLEGFFAGHLDEFEEMAADVSCLVDGALARQERVENLARRLNNAKQDMINRTLYALTLVTAIATPVTICTGYYGMNFDDMPELDPTLPGHENFGYKFFWKVILTVVCCMVFFLYRLGLFKTLL